MFEAASNREQYYQLLAERIYQIRREQEETKNLVMDKRTMVDGLDNAIPNRGDFVALNLWGKHDAS